MPQFKNGDIFSVKSGVVLITGNSFLKKDNSLVMGAGAALELKVRVPLCDKIYGQMVKQTSGHLGIYGILVREFYYQPFGLFQTKTHYSHDSKLVLISMSTDKLKKLALANPDQSYNLNFPGIGCGRLPKEKVLPIIKTLPKNVTIWSR
ncbi:MAG: hypothetical protein KAS32_21455 [Candidatus Peribacteraceae bacterium]|nr:hypothetical protein [Candidatus Peribacteraceae bacterium]